MTLKEQVDADIKSALIAGEREKVQTLRGLKAAILDEEVAKGARDDGLDDVAVQAIVAREVKKRRESETVYRKNDRDDLADNEAKESAIIERYLPAQIDEAELRDIIKDTISSLGVSDVKSMGQVIGSIKSAHGAAVDGALLARLTKEALQTK